MITILLYSVYLFPDSDIKEKKMNKVHTHCVLKLQIRCNITEFLSLDDKFLCITCFISKKQVAPIQSYFLHENQITYSVQSKFVMSLHRSTLNGLRFKEYRFFNGAIFVGNL